MHPTATRILRALESSAHELYTQELAEKAEVDRHTAAKYLAILDAAGWVSYRTVGNAKMWSPTTDGDERPPASEKGKGGLQSIGSLPTFDEERPPFSDDEAVVEAERCLQCGGPQTPAPCTEACPTSIDVPRFIQEIEDGRPLDAAETIFEANVLGGSCARVCPVEELCEGACVFDEEGRKPIAIGKLQRHATDKGLENNSPKRQTSFPPRPERVAVIGAGPSGLACAAELAPYGYQIMVYEQGELPGGLITRAIAPYKQHIEPLFEEIQRIKHPNITFRFGTTVGEDISIERLERIHDAVFMGIGMGRDYQTDLPGEELNGIWNSLDFIEALKLGPLPTTAVEGNVVVIGGGNTAIDVAREVVRLDGNARVVYRRNQEQMPAYPHEVAVAKREGVQFEFLANPRRYFGSDRVRGVQCIRMELGEPDSSGRPRPQAKPGTEFVLEADTVVKAIGQRPWWDLLSALDVDVDGGQVQAGANRKTSRPGVFAGGDCVNGGATVVEAVQDGKRAAEEMHRYLNDTFVEDRGTNGATPSTQNNERQAENFVREEERDAVRRYYQGAQYVGVDREACKGCDLCMDSCPADILHLDDHDKVVVDDPGDCIFCGLCEVRCPDFAIWIENDGALALRTEAFDTTMGGTS